MWAIANIVFFACKIEIDGRFCSPIIILMADYYRFPSNAFSSNFYRAIYINNKNKIILITFTHENYSQFSHQMWVKRARVTNFTQACTVRLLWGIWGISVNETFWIFEIMFTIFKYFSFLTYWYYLFFNPLTPYKK